MKNQFLKNSFLFEFITDDLKVENLEWQIQKVTLPNITASSAEYLNGPFKSSKGKIPAESLEYGNFSIEIILDDKLKVYDDILKLLKHSVNDLNPTHEKLKNGLLHMLDARNKIVCTFKFEDMFITEIDSFDLNVSEAQEVTTLNITFEFNKFNVEFKK